MVAGTAIGSRTDVTFFEVPMIGGLATLGRWFIDRGMRSGTPVELHDRVITVDTGTGDWKGLGFVLLAWLYGFLSSAWTPRAWLVMALVTLCGARLSAHIVRRNNGKGEDRRYQAMRASQGQAFWWRSLFTVFWLQGSLL